MRRTRTSAARCCTRASRCRRPSWASVRTVGNCCCCSGCVLALHQPLQLPAVSPPTAPVLHDQASWRCRACSACWASAQVGGCSCSALCVVILRSLRKPTAESRADPATCSSSLLRRRHLAGLHRPLHVCLDAGHHARHRPHRPAQLQVPSFERQAACLPVTGRLASSAGWRPMLLPFCLPPKQTLPFLLCPAATWCASTWAWAARCCWTPPSSSTVSVKGWGQGGKRASSWPAGSSVRRCCVRAAAHKRCLGDIRSLPLLIPS